MFNCLFTTFNLLLHQVRFNGSTDGMVVAIDSQDGLGCFVSAAVAAAEEEEEKRRGGITIELDDHSTCRRTVLECRTLVI